MSFVDTFLWQPMEPSVFMLIVVVASLLIWWLTS